MRTFYDYAHKQYCCEETIGNSTTAVWGDTKEEAIKRFNELKNKL